MKPLQNHRAGVETLADTRQLLLMWIFRGLFVIAILALLINAAHAGSNDCDGQVKVGPVWTTVITDHQASDFPNGCSFKTKSALGQRIIKVCPNQSECMIGVDLNERHSTAPNQPSTIIKKIRNVYRLPQ